MRKAQSSRGASSKLQHVIEYRDRLRKNIKAMGDHLAKIALAAKIPMDEGAMKAPSVGLVSEHYTLVNELCTRTALMARAADELLKLTNDIREFLIIRDFNFISHAVKRAEENVEQDIKQAAVHYDKFQHDLVAAHTEMDHELADNFGLRQ